MKSDRQNTLLAELGAVPIKARLCRQEFFQQYGGPLTRLGKNSRTLFKGESDPIKKRRLFVVSEAYGHCLRSGYFSARCYFEYLDIYDRASRVELCDISTAAMDLAHTFADTVPIELFNALELSKTPEFELVSGRSRDKMAAIFDLTFPNTREARDAVCHYHDRALGRFRNTDISTEMFGRSISKNGKFYTAPDGKDFEYSFSDVHFSRYFSQLEHLGI